MFEKVYGPYFKKGRFHVHLHFLDGSKQYKTFDDELAAREFVVRNARKVIADPIKVRMAIDEYLGARQDILKSSRATLKFRLEALVRGFEETPVAAFPALGAWTELTKTNAVDTLHGVRSAASGFFSWCVGRRYLKKNPLEGIEIVGQKKRGKEQLRLDEARSFLARALAAADGQALDGRGGSQQRVAIIGAATALLLGLRNSEVVERVVRDLDDEGRILCIPKSKTPAGARRLEIPEILRGHLVALAKGREPTAQLFEAVTADGLRYWTARLCEELGVPRVTVHGLRGTHATASMRPHANPHAVAAAIGHEKFSVTERHYIAPGAVEAARQEAATATLLASKKLSKSFGRQNGVKNPNPEPST